LFLVSLVLGYAIKNNIKKVLVEIFKEAEENMHKDKFADRQQIKSNLTPG